FDKGFRKRGGGKKVSSMTGSSGNPPPNGYCRRNRSPGAKAYMARFDMKNEPSGGFLFFRSASDKQLKQVDESGFTLANGKPDWAKILDRTLGPRRIAYKPLKVSLGKPGGSPKAAASIAGSQIPASDVPVPSANPLRRAEIEMRAKLLNTAQGSASGDLSQPASASIQDGAETAQAAPGSIFRKGLDFTVPVPAPSPRK
ncbi:MAG: D-alanyl-D-alanine carboxypeptidase, partial [Pseudomonadota bacterium]